MKAFKALELDLKGLKTLKLDPKSDGFDSFITCVFHEFEALEDEKCTEQRSGDSTEDPTISIL